MKKIFNYSLTVVAILIFMLSLYIIIFGTIAKKNNTLLDFFGYSSPAVLTGSMAGDNPDSFEAGAFLITKKVNYEDLIVGDIIVYQGDDKLIVHRITKINNDGSLETKGDANKDVDKIPVTESTYQAKVINSFSFFGLGTKLPAYQLTILGFVVIGLLIYVFVQVIQLIIMINKKKLEDIKKNY